MNRPTVPGSGTSPGPALPSVQTGAGATERVRAPEVYRAINRITAAFARGPIGKAHVNIIDQYHYRSIDDVLNRLGPLLARHRLCVLPRVLKRHSEQVQSDLGTTLVSVQVLVAFDLVSVRDGSRHVAKAWGEALDPSDKGTAKAMGSAFKHAMLQLFCVPVAAEDADASSHKLGPKGIAEPAQGWQAWADDIMAMVEACESKDALDRVRTRHAGMLGALKRSQSSLYQAIGDRFQQRTGGLAKPVALPKVRARSRPVEGSRPSSRAKAKPEDVVDA